MPPDSEIVGEPLASVTTVAVMPVPTAEVVVICAAVTSIVLLTGWLAGKVNATLLVRPAIEVASIVTVWPAL